MIEGTVPDEIREGPDAIRETVRLAGPAARDVAGSLARQRHPPRPRHRQRDELPLVPRVGDALPPPGGRRRSHRRAR